jgi:hypothetical protein
MFKLVEGKTLGDIIYFTSTQKSLVFTKLLRPTTGNLDNARMGSMEFVEGTELEEILAEVLDLPEVESAHIPFINWGI